ncbi:MAG: hydrogenase maturation nickel metallochaperone HypA [Candidatus Latescibacterota bacterium]|nr:MAG: hydrogenase maturation nickel metallochaperone HypA [Candidatus Latescibacterota bacterium]
MTIAQSLINAVRAHAKRRQGERIVAVGLRLGELSGVDAEALKFGFDSLIKGTDLDPLELQIEHAPHRHRCPTCDREFDVIDYDVSCPQCGTSQTESISGDEIEIIYLEVED